MRRLLIASMLMLLAMGPGGSLAAQEEPAATGTFSPAGRLTQARDSHTATLLPGGRILIVGGHNRRGGLRASAEAWDPVTASSGPAGSLVHARDGHTATLLLDGRVLIVGPGWNRQGLLRTRPAEAWDPATSSFDLAGSLGQGRDGHTVTLLSDGRVLVVGGYELPARRGCSDFACSLASAEVWDPATASFSPAGSLAEVRMGHTATALHDGRVLIAGGWPDAAAEVWDPATVSFSPAGSLDETRIEHTATLLPDGRVLVVGGLGFPSGALASAEIWDPATSFGPAGSLARARKNHTATALHDGRVLVVGGAEQHKSPTASVEVWEPGDR